MNRFLLFNIPVEIPLAELGREIAAANNINILELRRFIRKKSTCEVSPVLVTSLGSSNHLALGLFLFHLALSFFVFCFILLYLYHYSRCTAQLRKQQCKILLVSLILKAQM